MRSEITSFQQQIILERNKVIKNTYLLLSMSLVFSALCATFAVRNNIYISNIMIFIVGAYGLMFLVNVLKNSSLGILAVFAFTGFMGITLAPLLDNVLSFSNGQNILGVALGATGLIFMTLSGHVLTTNKDYSYLQGFLMVGILTAILASIAAYIFNFPAMQLAVSAAFVLISSGMILYETSNIVQGGERNYLLATVSLYVSLYNLFVSLLHILSALAGRRD